MEGTRDTESSPATRGSYFTCCLQAASWQEASARRGGSASVCRHVRARRSAVPSAVAVPSRPRRRLAVLGQRVSRDLSVHACKNVVVRLGFGVFGGKKNEIKKNDPGCMFSGVEIPKVGLCLSLMPTCGFCWEGGVSASEKHHGLRYYSYIQMSIKVNVEISTWTNTIREWMLPDQRSGQRALLELI